MIEGILVYSTSKKTKKKCDFTPETKGSYFRSETWELSEWKVFTSKKITIGNK